MNTRQIGPGRTGNAGFTLMELMVVIAIIGILAAVVVPKMVGRLDDANVKAAKAQISNFKTALIAYHTKFHKFPTTGEGLEELINNPKEKLLDSDSVPKDPWGNPYVYTSPGARDKDFEIVSYGRDGQPGGTGYDADIESWNLQGND
ncbi:MAG TPA: type II secretion system major pseudopilin GspG [Candidatus Hydrogenedentes bacterium]|nr:type II secretion system major pseudopilin GspG [Candidatus Hydrogenedentota bacterium]